MTLSAAPLAMFALVPIDAHVDNTSNHARPNCRTNAEVPVYTGFEKSREGSGSDADQATEVFCAPARVGARVMVRISPSELWRMATTGWLCAGRSARRSAR